MEAVNPLNFCTKREPEMKQGQYIKDEKLLKQGVDILMEKLGTIETSRFLSFTPQKWIESVKRHQSGNPNSSKKEFLNNSFGSKQENCKGISKLKERCSQGET